MTCSAVINFDGHSHGSQSPSGKNPVCLPSLPLRSSPFTGNRFTSQHKEEWEGGLQVREKEWGCILLRVPNPVLGGLEHGLWSSTTLVKNLCALVSSSVKWGQEEQSSPHRIWGQLNEFTQVQVLYKG